MAFIQGIKPGDLETRNSAHIPTKIYKKGQTFLKAAGSFAGGAIKFVNPLFNIFNSAGVTTSRNSPVGHLKKGITLSCNLIKFPSAIAKTALQAPKMIKKKGVELVDGIVNTASNVAAIALGVMTCLKLGDTIVSLCSAISSSLGTGFKVVGSGISAALPFIGVFSAIEIVKSMLDIGKESIKLYKTAKKISLAKEKMKIWSKMEWNDPTYISEKLSRMKVKQIKTVKGLEQLEGTLKTSTIALQSHVLHVTERWTVLEARKQELEGQNPVVRLFGQIVPQIKLTAAILKKEAHEKKHLSALQSHSKITAKHTMRAIKIRNYDIIEGKIKSNSLKERDLVALKHFQTSQIEKYKTKESNLKVDVIYHGLKIGLRVLVVISMVATLALTMSGIGTGPGIITNASVIIFVMIAEYGLEKFREFNPPKLWIPVKVPVLQK